MSKTPPAPPVESQDSRSKTSSRSGLPTADKLPRLNRRDFLQITAAAGVGSVLGGQLSARAAEAIPVTGTPVAKASHVTELFLDNKMIEVTPGVSRRLHQPKKHLLNPVVRCDRWWEGNNMQPYTTMYDKEDKLFKMWARAGSDWRSNRVGGNAAYMVYLTSTDGVQWNKPELGAIEIGGRRDHNIVFASDMIAPADSLAKGRYIEPSKVMPPQGKKAFFWSVTKNPKPRNAGEKFVALAIVQDHRRGAHIATSPDGIKWTCGSVPIWQSPNDVSGVGDDCLMNIIYDPAKGKWVIYRRTNPEFGEHLIADEGDRERKRLDRYYRTYAYAESDDLRVWKNHRPILSMEPDDPADTELYQFSAHKFGEIYVGYVSVFHLIKESIDVELATSRDGVRFTRVCRGTPFIPSGATGYYDYMAMACTQPEPIVVNDTVYLYYAALNFLHSAGEADLDPAVVRCGAALATFKRDRFVSLETGAPRSGPSRVVTKPFKVEHPRVYLNAATWAKGSIRVEALTRDWQPIPGFTAADGVDIQGNALDFPVRWKDRADLHQLSGKEIRLKFYMTDARIHALTLSAEERKLGAVSREDGLERLGDSSPTAI